jgi:hypothetical protein
MTAPFERGDRVVCTAPHDMIQAGGLVRDEVYTVSDIWFCCKPSGYRISLAGIRCPGIGRICAECHDVRGGNGWMAVYFRKVDDISDHTTESLLNELSEPVKQAIL